jgi:hypothetical protein
MEDCPKLSFLPGNGGWTRVPWDRIAKVEIGALGATLLEIADTQLREILAVYDDSSVHELIRRVPATDGWISIPDQLDPGHLQFVRFSRVENVSLLREIEHPELETVILSANRNNTIELARSVDPQVKQRVLDLIQPGQ